MLGQCQDPLLIGLSDLKTGLLRYLFFSARPTSLRYREFKRSPPRICLCLRLLLEVGLRDASLQIFLLLCFLVAPLDLFQTSVKVAEPDLLGTR